MLIHLNEYTAAVRSKEARAYPMFSALEWHTITKWLNEELKPEISSARFDLDHYERVKLARIPQPPNDRKIWK